MQTIVIGPEKGIIANSPAIQMGGKQYRFTVAQARELVVGSSRGTFTEITEKAIQLGYVPVPFKTAEMQSVIEQELIPHWQEFGLDDIVVILDAMDVGGFRYIKGLQYACLGDRAFIPSPGSCDFYHPPTREWEKDQKFLFLFPASGSEVVT